MIRPFLIGANVGLNTLSRREYEMETSATVAMILLKKLVLSDCGRRS